jgi:hypothetical protein
MIRTRVSAEGFSAEGLAERAARVNDPAGARVAARRVSQRRAAA